MSRLTTDEGIRPAEDMNESSIRYPSGASRSTCSIMLWESRMLNGIRLSELPALLACDPRDSTTRQTDSTETTFSFFKKPSLFKNNSTGWGQECKSSRRTHSR